MPNFVRRLASVYIFVTRCPEVIHLCAVWSLLYTVELYVDILISLAVFFRKEFSMVICMPSHSSGVAKVASLGGQKGCVQGEGKR